VKITGIRTRHYESVADAGRNAAIKPTNHIKDGWIVLDDTPGIGLDFDVEALAPLLVDSPLPAPRSGRRRGAALYQLPYGP